MQNDKNFESIWQLIILKKATSIYRCFLTIKWPWHINLT